MEQKQAPRDGGPLLDGERSGRRSLSDYAIERVRDFWNQHPVGAHFVRQPFGTPEFFAEYRDFRYRTEWHLRNLIPFEQYVGKVVLEVGCGLGADGTCFAQNGTEYVGIDLADLAAQATRLHFQSLGLQGKFLTASAEHLPFAQDTFALAYCHGVLHHLPHAEEAVKEIYRVLKPGGHFIGMIYHKHSLNYTVRILVAMRLAVLAYVALRGFLPVSWRQGTLERHYRVYRPTREVRRSGSSPASRISGLSSVTSH